ncbi:type II toxin-antitoxin system RelE/ParE family toxin [Methylobacterium sp. NEAU K]|uniref:type II toxin-antitoxin system RelE/ParE family toxin n=1 Tax=Methylobacterium sp. NEAU K TaxID=3064946 RepID=UPI002732D872|nr:type II toxin-antitoxin system RelE/ParE family toxin [Methylobacterium sp. NEAU K]MDP4005383.1 type II toxin-antitoxin system RelE/ParE family toxin [Methylobacterium sp. NEAU K]
MRLRLTRPAASQLDQALAYIDRRNRQGARKVQQRLQAAMELRGQHPFAGSITARPGVRRLIARPYPYAITYCVAADEIVILGIRHAARQPQP